MPTPKGGGTGPGGGAAGAHSRPAFYDLARAGNLEYDRVLFFSDAVFAIAITLLVVDLPSRAPQTGQVHAAAAIEEAFPRILSFGISFAVIGLFWMGHHGVFRQIVALDRPLIVANLLFLGAIAFLPYPTSLLSLANSQAASTILYAASAGFAGLAELVLWLHATHTPGLVSPVVSARLRRYVTLRLLRMPLVFLLSIPVAVAVPSAGAYVWIAIAAAGFALRRWHGSGGGDDTEPVG